MPVGRSYSDRYQMQDKKDEEDEMYLSQQASRERVRKLSAETNRRRKALELKKKLEAQKEAKRRHEVLEERRKRQQEATQRYQRLSRASPKKANSRQDAVYTGPKLQDGIPMARGYRVNKIPDQPTPTMEDVLRMVGHQDEQSPQSRPQPSNLNLVEQQHDYYTYEQNGQQDQAMHFADKNANTMTRGADQSYHQKYHGYAAPATLTHDQNIGDNTEPSVSYQPDRHPTEIQRELAEQQREFIEQQKKSLMEFNRALFQESVSKGLDVDCSSSVSSVDSLEEEDQQPSKKVNFAGNQRSEEKIIKDSVISGPTALQHGNSRDDSTHTLSRVQDGNKYEDNNRPLSFQSSEQTYSTGCSDNSLYLSKNHNGQVMSGEHNTVKSELSSQPVFVPASSNADQSQNGYHSYSLALDENTQEDTTGSRSVYAWNNSGRPSKPAASKTQSFQNSAPKTTTKFHNDNTKSRGFSTKTSATPVYMLTPSSHKHTVVKKKELTSKESFQKTSNVAKNVYNSTLEDDRLHPDDRLHSGYEADHQEQRVQIFDEITPKSILKKTSKYSGNVSTEDSPSHKWGKNELRDSIDIASTTHIKRVPSKKYVRWTDLNYTGEEVRTTEKSENMVEAKPTPVEKQKPVVNARTVQQKLAASSGMDQPSSKGPVLLPRSPFRNKFASPTNRPGTEGQSVMEQKSYAGRNYSTPVGKPPTGKPSESAKVTPKRVNGMTLNKTPTDEEINQLWDKVRTCLHSREATPEPKAAERTPLGMRRAASDQSLAESSQRLTANFRVMQPNRAQGVEQVKMKKFHTVPRWRTSSDSGTNLSRRSSLLQQRQGKRLVTNDNRKRGTLNAPAPVTSHEGPNRSTTINQHTYIDQVEDSLQAFQQAELLAQQNFSEAEIEAALYQQGPSNHLHESKMLSALSLEEQRILESLDRLNEKLRITSDIATNYPAMTPKPPAYNGREWKY
ncbi:hypothetical protein HOLleu_32713 [Holothuria leucospilota]|uniref:Uncharacterized protein n=1 Tax=Holothuria leucospilota TaxID=206669 RepID=A0A9Q1BJ93_HOLLE|nr:hypothetical protein HOLleu_32713 [Holothuria leucospilota]